MNINRKEKNEKMKKIGLITFHSAHNYGAMLQVYALQSKLQKENDVEIIDYRNDIIDNQYKVININKENLKSLIKSFISTCIFFVKSTKRYNKFNEFMNNKLNITKKKYNSELDLEKEFPKKDIYITGSDQVWNTDITRGLQNSYTLNFGDETIKRISYAASIGNSTIKDDEKEIYKEKLSKLDYISVREEDAKREIESIVDKKVEVVLDPTLLLEKNEWENEIKDIEKEKEKYILAYVVEYDEEFVKIVNELSKETNLKVIHFSKKNLKIKNVLRNAYTDGPLEFVNLIKNAEYVICTSFHATVFSIIFNKKFFVVPHKKTGSRVTNLLKKLNISNRAVPTLDIFKAINYDENIDYEKVNDILKVERNKSINWIKNTINNCE